MAKWQKGEEGFYRRKEAIETDEGRGDTRKFTLVKQNAASKFATLNIAKQPSKNDGHTRDSPSTSNTANQKDKNPRFDLRVREALLIRRFNSGPG